MSVPMHLFLLQAQLMRQLRKSNLSADMRHTAALPRASINSPFHCSPPPGRGLWKALCGLTWEGAVGQGYFRGPTGPIIWSFGRPYKWVIDTWSLAPLIECAAFESVVPSAWRPTRRSTVVILANCHL